MASHCIRREGKSSNAAPFGFYMIITTLQDGKIQLPKEFIKQCGHTLPTKVTLKVPNDIPWEVDLIHSNGNNAYIHKGWKEFKDYYSMGLGHVLIFEYDCKSHFDIRIFDLTSLEIKYPVNTEKTDDSAVFKKEKLTRQIEKRKRTILEESDDHIENDGSFEVDKKKWAAYERAKNFKSKNPFCIIWMQSTYVSSHCGVNVPVAFARKNLPGSRNDVLLRVSSGKTWHVGCNLRKSKYANFASGWQTFVRDNGLRLGDVCIFEVKNRNKLEWDVTIFNQGEASGADQKEKQFLDKSQMEGFVDENVKSNQEQAQRKVFKKASENDTATEVPDYLCCKITLDIFRDPVITPSGITYERANILDHLKKLGEFDPVTREPLLPSQLVPNYAMKEAVRAYLDTK